MANIEHSKTLQASVTRLTNYVKNLEQLIQEKKK
jgi:hypothetical protein